MKELVLHPTDVKCGEAAFNPRESDFRVQGINHHPALASYPALHFHARKHSSFVHILGLFIAFIPP